MAKEAKISLRGAILDFDDLKKESIDLPEWNIPKGRVYVKEMNGLERTVWEEYLLRDTGQGQNGEEGAKEKKLAFREDNYGRGLLAALTLIDEENQRIFKADDAEKLCGKSSVALDRIATVALRLNRMTTEMVQEEKENLPDGQSSAITTA